MRQVGKCGLLCITPCTYASIIVNEHGTYAVMYEGCQNNSSGGMQNCDVGTCE